MEQCRASLLASDACSFHDITLSRHQALLCGTERVSIRAAELRQESHIRSALEQGMQPAPTHHELHKLRYFSLRYRVFKSCSGRGSGQISIGTTPTHQPHRVKHKHCSTGPIRRTQVRCKKTCVPGSFSSSISIWCCAERVWRCNQKRRNGGSRRSACVSLAFLRVQPCTQFELKKQSAADLGIESPALPAFGLK
jgi:hypothetical protein